MKTQITILAILVTFFCSAAWNIEHKTDEMTDERSYSLWTTGTVVNIDSILHDRPQLHIRISSPKYQDQTDKLQGKIAVYFSLEMGGVRRSGAQVMYRIDDADPVTEVWTPATDRRGAFSPNPVAFYKALKNAKTLRIRYVTTLGGIYTSRFDLSGLADAVAKVTAQEKARKKPDD